ncbi:type IV pilin [Salinarchaeum laminariae]|uniref:type IV pilin n=1 Tax=Salinarchaeum laminariae TaxID=869888 RepID=UPI0020C0CDEB|nr:type IV pilin N-terminal domain-containing protein [Salinarchaeum laminariae]
MELRALSRDDDAISSVLGVVLMVAVTIILAAVIGTFVLGIGSELTDSSPSASWEFSENVNASASNSTVTILHASGEKVDASTLEVTIGGKTAYADGNEKNGYSVNDDNWGDPVTASDRLVIKGNDMDGKMVRLYWSNGDSSSILADERLG